MSPRRQSIDHSKPHRSGYDGGPAEAAAFISTTLADLKLLSRRHDLVTLTYLLDLAHMEAEDIVGFGAGKP